MCAARIVGCGVVEGVLRETTDGWLPTVEGAGGSASPEAGRILHLLKASLPYRQSGYTVRSTYTLKALQQAGYDPVAMTPLDFPRSIGIPDAPVEETVDGHPVRPPGPAHRPTGPAGGRLSRGLGQGRHALGGVGAPRGGARPLRASRL